MKYIAILILITTPLFLVSQTSASLLRKPAISSDGSKIAFSYQGDIMTCNADGSSVNRLTIHEAYESYPQWSPDDSKIAFISNRHGNNDIFVVDSNGQDMNRLNYHSTSDSWPRWTSNNEIVFTTRRNFVQLEREGEIHKIPSSGGTPTRILDAVGSMATVSPNGRFVAFVRGSCRTTREAYRGPANRDIWLYDKQNDTYTQLSTSTAQEISPDFGSNSTLYYLSAENGRYNIYSIQLDNNGKVSGEAKAITKYKKEGIRSFDVSADGSSIVYEYITDLYLIKLDSKATKLQISVPEDYRFYPEEKKKLSGDASDYALSPDEKYMAYVAKGEVFVKRNDKEKKNSVNMSNHAYRELKTDWLNDSTLIYISDRTGNYDLFMTHSTDSTEQNLFKSFKKSTVNLTSTPEDEFDFILSPDRKRICLLAGRGKLTVADINEKGEMSNSITLLDTWDTPGHISWSPDGKWLAYNLSDLNFNEEVYIHAADGSIAPVNVSMHPRNDSEPVWSKDGSKLGFLSIRNNGDADVWFAWLSKKDWEKSKADWDEDDEDEPVKKNGKKDKENKQDSTETEELIKVDLKDIHERLQQVTRLPGNEDNLQIDKEGEVFYFTTNSGGRSGTGGKRELKSVKWDGSEEKTVLSNGGISILKWDDKGKYLYGIQRGGKLARIKVEGAKLEKLPHTAKMKSQRQKEREQIFGELWRSLNQNFYDPDFHGQDFKKLKAKYKERILNASTTQDFRDMVNEMLGQINASHMGLNRTPNPEKTQKDQTGILGIEVKPLLKGVEITHVVPNSPADKDRSKLNIGEVITHVNAEAIVSGVNFYELLDDAKDERILLQVVEKNGTAHEVIIRPTNSVSSLLYEEWVDQQKALAEKYSNGRLGYLHIKGMGWSEFERFERELMASGHGKEGIVIDVRFNGGGWTTDMVMAVLNVRQHAYTIPRGATKSLKKHGKFSEYYAYGERLPLSSWTKPSIAMCNETSISNAEIFSHAYKTLGIGTLVGQPTFGAVISTGARTLMDGSYIRLPFRAWYVKATGQNMEFEPAVPDILVQNPPEARSKGYDVQLKKAVEELLRQIDEKN